MSTLKVDNLRPNLGTQVDIPNLKPLVGSILKAERKTYQTTSEVSNSSFSQVMSFTYTPVSATSKIFIQASMWMRPYRNNGYDCRYKYRLQINGSTEHTSTYVGIYDYGNNGVWFNHKTDEILEFDSISTAPITVTVQVATQGALSVKINEENSQSQMFFTEIAQ